MERGDSHGVLAQCEESTQVPALGSWYAAGGPASRGGKQLGGGGGGGSTALEGGSESMFLEITSVHFLSLHPLWPLVRSGSAT